MSLKDTVRDLVNDYLDAVREGRHTTGRRAPKKPRAATIAMYEAVLLRVFLPWAEAVKLEPVDLNDKAIDKFTRDLTTRKGKSGKPLTATTVQSYARDLNTFFRWTAKQGSTGAVRMVVEAPAKRKLELLTQAEVAKLIETAGSLRDKIIVRILAECGCRLGELLSLTVGDVHREDGVHFITFVDREGGRRLKTKSSARTAAIQRDLFKDLRTYIESRPGGDEDGTPIFISARRSRKNGYEPLSDSGVQQMLKHLAVDAEIAKPERVHPHMFRHLFATEYLRDTKDPVTLSKILGHSSLTMINATYANLDDRDIQRATLEHLERIKKRK